MMYFWSIQAKAPSARLSWGVILYKIGWGTGVQSLSQRADSYEGYRRSANKTQHVENNACLMPGRRAALKQT